VCHNCQVEEGRPQSGSSFIIIINIIIIIIATIIIIIIIIIVISLRAYVFAYVRVCVYA
jgi:hypothetical protein